MNHILNTKIHGRILHVDKDRVYRASKNILLKSKDSGLNWEVLFSFSSKSLSDKLISSSHLLSRAFRQGFHYSHPLNENLIGVIFNKNIVIFDHGNSILDQGIVGSRPLSFGLIDNEFVFGEYRSNPERSEISVYG